jgi:hypothetical protein
MANIFRQAKELLKKKTGSEMTDEERALVSQAIIPLNILTEFNDIKISEGLEILANLIESNHSKKSPGRVNFKKGDHDVGKETPALPG